MVVIDIRFLYLVLVDGGEKGLADLGWRADTLDFFLETDLGS